MPINHWNGEAIPLILPPTYVDYRRTEEPVGEKLASFLGQEGYRVAGMRLPLKALAVQSGLARFGRNNLAYRAGMGSFLQLAGYYSDLPCRDDPWREPEMLERCESCTACLSKCPTGAMLDDRFLLCAERCVTFHNESDRPLPDWLASLCDDSLLGCMVCQRTCPENKAVRKCIEDRGTFSHEETEHLLAGDSPERLPAEILSKLQQLGLTEDLKVVLRNLSMLVTLAPAPWDAGVLGQRVSRAQDGHGFCPRMTLAEHFSECRRLETTVAAELCGQDSRSPRNRTPDHCRNDTPTVSHLSRSQACSGKCGD